MSVAGEHSQSRERIIALVNILFKARFARDLEQFRPYLAPDIVYRMVGHRFHSPFSGEFRGPDAVLTGVHNMNIEFEFEDMSLDKLIFDSNGNDVAVRWHGRWKNRGTNAAADFEGFAHLQFENGLVKSYTNFVDTALVANISGWD